MTDDVDAFLDSLMDLTRGLGEALSREDLEETGAILTRRGELMEAWGAKKCVLTEAQKARFKEIIALDKEAARRAAELKESLKARMVAAEKMKDGLIGYSRANHDLSSGQIVDKKR